MTALWVVFGLYLLGLLVLGEVLGRTRIVSLEDYLLSGRTHGTILTGAALAATVIGAGSTIGAAGVAYYVGISASWYLLSAVPGLLLLAYTLGPVLRERSVYSVPEFLSNRYGQRTGWVAAALGVLGLVLFLAAQFYAMGALISRLAPVGLRTGLLVSAVAVILYTWRGGNWAVHWSDTIQIVWIVIGAGVALGLALAAAGGPAALTDPPAAEGFRDLGRAWFHPISRSRVEGWDPFALGNTVVAWIIMSTTWHFAMQSTAQRFLSARDGDTVRRACLLAAAVLVPLAVMFGLLGMSARELYPDLPPGTAGAMREQVRALPALLRGVLPPVAGGVVLAALVAVMMSTCDSALLGGSTLLVRDLVPRSSDGRDDGRGSGAVGGGQSAGAGRGRRYVLVLGAFALVAALVSPGLVQLLELVAAVYSVALFCPLLVGHYWSGATGPGALASMVTSGAVGLGWRLGGLEEHTGVHMLNLALPVAFLALVGGSLIHRRLEGRGGDVSG